MTGTTVRQDSLGTSSAQATPRRGSNRRARRESIAGWGFALPFFLSFVLVFLIPIFVSLYKSFFKLVPKGGGLFGGGESTEQFVGFLNYQEVLGNPRFWAGVGRVLIYALFQIPVMTLAALGLALLLDSFLTRHVTVYRLGYFLPFAIPGIVAAMVWLYLYTPEISPIVKGLASIGISIDFMSKNIILASMANMTTWTYTGYNMLIFMAALQSIPHDLYDAAYIDGANGWKVVRHIKVPMVRGALLLSVLLSIIGTIQLFNEPTVMETVNTWMGKDYTPMMMSYNTMMGTLSPSGDGPASAVSIVMAIIAGVLAAIYALAQRKVSR